MAIEYVNGKYVRVPDYGMVTAPNWTTPNRSSVPPIPPTGGNLGGLWSRLKNFKMPDLNNLNNMRSNFVSKPIIGGTSIANIANTAGGIYHGVNALQGLNANANADRDLESLKRDITLSKATNPMYDMYLDASDEKLLREMNNNNTSANWTAAGTNVMNSIPRALLNAGLGFLTGNIPGAVIQGVGTLANAGVEGYGQGTAERYGQLQGLYDKLQRANDDYRSMKRPRGLRQAGLQTQYFNQLY